jgi:hypothetical protein
MRHVLRVSLEQAQALDQRRPVVSISIAEQLVCNPDFGAVSFTASSRNERNKILDELLLEEGTALGPVVALGNPSDPVRPAAMRNTAIGRR